MSSSRSRAGSLPASSLPPNGIHLRNSPGWRTNVAKMLVAPAAGPPAWASSSRAWPSASPGGRGGMRGSVGRGDPWEASLGMARQASPSGPVVMLPVTILGKGIHDDPSHRAAAAQPCTDRRRLPRPLAGRPCGQDPVGARRRRHGGALRAASPGARRRRALDRQRGLRRHDAAVVPQPRRLRDHDLRPGVPAGGRSRRASPARPGEQRVSADRGTPSRHQRRHRRLNRSAHRCTRRRLATHGASDATLRHMVVAVGLRCRAMIELATAAVEAALAAGARYADARVMVIRHESMEARNRVVEDLSQTEDAGLGVRALVESSWGFQATPTLSGPAARTAGAAATAVAKASARVPGAPLRLSPAPTVVESWSSTWVEHPLDDVDLADKADLP